MPVFVEAVHSVRPLSDFAFDRWVDWYGNVAMPAMIRNGFEVLGAWKRTGGHLGQDVLLMRFEHVGAFDRAGASLRKDTEFQHASALMSEEFQVSESVKVGVRTPYASANRLEGVLRAQPAEPRQYLQTVTRITSGRGQAAKEALGHIAEQREFEGTILAVGYETTIGPRDEITDLWLLPNRLLNLTYRPGSPSVDSVNKLRDAAPEESSYYLNPLPYSPMQ